MPMNERQVIWNSQTCMALPATSHWASHLDFSLGPELHHSEEKRVKVGWFIQVMGSLRSSIHP